MRSTEEVFQVISCYPKLASAFRDSGAFMDKHWSLYEVVADAILNETASPDQYIFVFQKLKEKRVTIPADFKLYQKSVDRIEDAGEFLHSFEALKNRITDNQTFLNLYKIFLDKKRIFFKDISTLPESPGYEQQTDIHAKVRGEDNSGNSGRTDISRILILLDELGLLCQEHLEIIEFILFSLTDKLKNDILSYLKNNQLDVVRYPQLYNILFLQDPPLALNPALWFKVKYLINKEKLKSDRLINTQEIFKNLFAEGGYREGPLMKSKATFFLEDILKKIGGLTDFDQLEMSFEPALGYSLKFKDKSKIYLTELLRLVNFNHLMLTTEQISALEEKMIPAFDSKIIMDNSFFNQGDHLIQQLPMMVQLALSYYTTTCYKNINRLFRGDNVEISNTDYDEHPHLMSQYLLLNFLLGCLVNWGARMLFLLTEGKQEYQISSLHMAKRKEKLTKQDINRRLAHPECALNVVSFSLSEEGSPYITDYNTITYLNLSQVSCVVINLQEAEILFPQGTLFQYVKKEEDIFFAEIINSPDLVPKEEGWPFVALSEAYYYLNRPYEDCSDTRYFDGQVVYRPNHGLLHTYRVMCYIDPVISYFAQNAKNEDFRFFCQNITFDQRNWLKIAAAYSVTGRESEISFQDNPRRYSEFREASAEYFRLFVQKYRSHSITQQMLEWMVNIIQYMGDPLYETQQHPKECHFLHRILTVAHKLDLPRCYSVQSFEKAIHILHELSCQNQVQHADYVQLIQYVTALIQAHGDTLRVIISTSSGKLMDVQIPYDQSRFFSASNSLKEARAVINNIPQPMVFH